MFEKYKVTLNLFSSRSKLESKLPVVVGDLSKWTMLNWCFFLHHSRIFKHPLKLIDNSATKIIETLC